MVVIVEGPRPIPSHSRPIPFLLLLLLRAICHVYSKMSDRSLIVQAKGGSSDLCDLICSAAAAPIIARCTTTRAAAGQVEGSPGRGTARGSAGASLRLRVRGDGLPAAAGCAQHGRARAPVGA